MEKSQQVNLGCGTLILIALIVAIFGAKPIKSQMDQVDKELGDLQTQVSAQSEEIRGLKDVVEKLVARLAERPSDQ